MGFWKAGLLRDDNEEDSTPADEDVRRQFKSDTDEEEEEFIGFRVITKER